jgi:hypothetical protein
MMMNLGLVIVLDILILSRVITVTSLKCTLLQKVMRIVRVWFFGGKVLFSGLIFKLVQKQGP